MRTRMTVVDRRAQLLEAAIVVARRDGYQAITRGSVAEQAGCSRPLLNNYFGSLETLRNEVVRTAIKREDMRIIAQALLMHHPLTRRLPKELKARAISVLS